MKELDLKRLNNVIDKYGLSMNSIFLQALETFEKIISATSQNQNVLFYNDPKNNQVSAQIFSGKILLDGQDLTTNET
jgi:putative lipase involved disintegration of autophagic bodies